MVFNSSTKRFSSWCADNWRFVVGFAVLAAAANFFLFQFYSQEKYVYFWDWSAYQNHFIFIVNKFNLGFFPALLALVYSAAFTEYSLLIPFIIGPLGLMFGTGRQAFLFLILNIFALPAALGLGMVFVRLIHVEGKHKRLYALIPAGILLTAPQFWVPLLLGFFDAGVLLPIVGIWLLMTDEDQNRKKAIGVGILLVLLLFTRRWLGYWIVSFFPAIFFQWLYSKLKKQRPFWNFSNIIVCGLTASLLLLVLGAPIARQMLTTNYAQMFSAFKAGQSTLQVVLAAALHFGWLSLLFALGGLWFAFKKTAARPLIQIIGLQFFLVLLLFSRVQLIDLHHYYQFVIVIALLQSIFIYSIWQSTWPKSSKALLTALFAGVLAINFAQAFFPGMELKNNPLHLFAGAKHHPLTRHDTPELARLIQYLDQTVPNTAKLYVAASSLVLNDDVVRNSCRYLDLPQTRICNSIIPANNVDLRDGFPRQFLAADYVITTSPAQYHLRPNDQQVVILLTQRLLDSQSIGSSYTKLPERFELDGKVQVIILKKIRPFKSDELQELSNEFLKLYPGRNDLFQIQPVAAPAPSPQIKKNGWLEACKLKIRHLIGDMSLKDYFRSRLGGSDITGETAY